MTSVDVLIAGAGPAGSALAAALARRWRVRPAGRGRAASSAEGLRRVREPAHRRGARPPGRRGRLGRGGRSPAWDGPACRRPHDADQLRRRPRATRGVGTRPAKLRRDAGGPRSEVRCGAARADPSRRPRAPMAPASVGRPLRDAVTGRRRGRHRPAGPSARTARGRASAAWSVPIGGCASRDASGWWRTTPASRDLTDHGEMHVGQGYYVGLAPTPGGELNVGMALPMDHHGISPRALRGGHRRPAGSRSPARRAARA